MGKFPWDDDIVRCLVVVDRPSSPEGVVQSHHHRESTQETERRHVDSASIDSVVVFKVMCVPPPTPQQRASSGTVTFFTASTVPATRVAVCSSYIAQPWCQPWCGHWAAAATTSGMATIAAMPIAPINIRCREMVVLPGILELQNAFRCRVDGSGGMLSTDAGAPMGVVRRRPENVAGDVRLSAAASASTAQYD